MTDYMKLGDEYLLHTYNRFPLVLERGEGVKLYDDRGREYLDFAAGIAVYALGYGNKDFNDALKAQIKKPYLYSHLHRTDQPGPPCDLYDVER